jgi:cystathionine gamma-synthase
MGAVAGPFDAWLVQRGLKTLAVRMERHCDNAERVVEFLLGHRRVRSVLYPGLADHLGHLRLSVGLEDVDDLLDDLLADLERALG